MATVTEINAKPESTIEPYYTDLNGVDSHLNMLCRNVLWGTLSLVVVFVMAVRIMESIRNRMRQSSILSSSEESQTSWKKPRAGWTCKVKKHLIYASLWNKRHHREYRFWSMNFGTLPSRLHATFILVYLASNITYMAVLKYDTPNRYAIFAELRGRSGTLCVANFIPLVILAGRNNPLIPLLRISFDTYNLFHRWIGRIAIAQVVVHAVCWTIPVVADGGWSLVRRKLGETLFIASGFTGLMCMVLIFFISSSPLRHAFYETFLNLHALLAAFIFICTWVHCASTTIDVALPQLPWIMAVVILWAADRASRIARVLYLTWPCRREPDSRRANAFCEALPGDVTRVTVTLNRFVNIKPGTHAYLRFLGVRVWETHPFSIAWVDHDNYNGRGKTSSVTELQTELPCGKSTVVARGTSVSFLIAARSGWTRTLFEKASSCAQGLRITAFVEGPYAGYHNLDSYGHLVLFAGAGGITHQISYARPLLEGSIAGLVATRRLTLVWIVRDLSSLEWVRPHLDEIQSMQETTGMLRMKIFVTGQNNRSSTSPSKEKNPMIQIFRGRPDITNVLDEELDSQIGAMCVSVCGPGGLADDVRCAVRAAQGASVVDFIEESFTW